MLGWLARYLAPDEVYVPVELLARTRTTAPPLGPQPARLLPAHTDFDGAAAELVGRDGYVHCVRLVVD